MPQTDPSSTDDAVAIKKPEKSLLRRVFSAIVWLTLWLYFFSLLAVWLLIRQEGERWWIATLLMFGPRWVFGLPLVGIAPLALLQGRKSTLMCVVSALFFGVGILHFEVPWRTVFLPAQSQQTLRLMTCNTDRQNINIPRVAQVIREQQPDVVVLQEWTSTQAQRLFPPPWHVRIDADMLVAAKDPIENAQSILQPHPGLEGVVLAYEIMRPAGTIRLINVHLASPHPWFDNALRGSRYAPMQIIDSCRQRRLESEQAAAAAHSSDLPTLLAGDFNTPIDSENFRTVWSDFTDAFSFAGTGVGTTYRVKDTRTRIDHILLDSHWQCRRCYLGADVGSPHLPVIADLQIKN